MFSRTASAIHVHLRGVRHLNRQHTMTLKPHILDVPLIRAMLMGISAYCAYIPIAFGVRAMFPGMDVGWIIGLMFPLVLAAASAPLVRAWAGELSSQSVMVLSCQTQSQAENNRGPRVDVLGTTDDLIGIAMAPRRFNFVTVANLGPVPGLLVPIVPLLTFPVLVACIIYWRLPSASHTSAGVTALAVALGIAWTAPAWTTVLWRTRVFCDSDGINIVREVLLGAARLEIERIEWSGVDRVTCDCTKWTLEIRPSASQRTVALWLIQYSRPAALVQAVVNGLGSGVEIGAGDMSRAARDGALAGGGYRDV